MSFTPTSQQLDAIRGQGSSILVSAGAGAGKTAVLSERCAYLVMDAPDRCNIDEMLVVTFTDAAAAEMRDRIGRALHLRQADAAATSSESQGHVERRIEHQLHLLEGAQISTIHAFCRRVLVRYFSRAGLDPQAPLLDARDAALLRRDCALRVFEEWSARDDAGGMALLDLLAAYGGSGDSHLIDIALRLDDFLATLSNPQEWIANALARTTPGANGLREEWQCRWADALRGELRLLLELTESALAAMAGYDSVVDKIRDVLVGFADKLHQWRERIQASDASEHLDEICGVQLAGYVFPRLPPKTARIKQLEEEIVRQFDDARARARQICVQFKNRLLSRFAHFTAADWAAGIERTRPHVETLLAFRAEIRDEYDRARREHGVLDFNDLERRTLNLLRDESNGVAAQLRRQFRHVLVDEFQDVNPIQDEILRLVSREFDTTQPGNLFTVGDVKQSIYRFRLAEPRIFLNRINRFREGTHSDDAADPLTSDGAAGRVIDLQSNFRSAPSVLDAINGLFERLMARDLGDIDYDEHARLNAGANNEPTAGPAMEVHVLDRVKGAAANTPGNGAPDAAGDQNDGGDSAGAMDDTDGDALDLDQIEHEAFAMARCIHAQRAAGHEFKDMVILLRSMKARAGQLIRALAQQGVPAFADTGGSLFESVEVQQILALLALLDNERLDLQLAAVLRSTLWERPLTDDQLAAIRIHANAIDRALPYPDAVVAYAARGPDMALRENLTDFLKTLAGWRGRMRCQPVAEVLAAIYDETGCLANVSGLPDAMQRRANLLQLHEYARQFGDFRRQGLYRFLRFLEDIRQSEEDLDAGSAAAPAGDVVRIMTIHRSKGLEFPVVILGEAGRKFNQADSLGDILFDRYLGPGLMAVDVEQRVKYPTLPHRLVQDSIRRETLAEELRVLYVALTRAKKKLFVVGTPRYKRELIPAAQPGGGPLPLIERSGADSMLDWVLSAMRQAPEGRVAWPDRTTPADPLYVVHHHSADVIRNWSKNENVPAPVQARLDRFSAFESIAAGSNAAAPASGDLTATVIRRLSTPYARAPLTRVPAVAAASVLKRRWSALPEDEEPATTMHDALPLAGAVDSPARAGSRRMFRQPAFAGETTPDGAALGTATHEFLQRLDLRERIDRESLRAQLDALLSAGVLSHAEASAIDLDAIAWFFSSELGERLLLAARDSSRVLREWPFVLGVDPARYDATARAQDAGDVLLVRGIIDCMFAEPAADTASPMLHEAPASPSPLSWEILDYKTDRVTGEALDERVRQYAGQLQIYAQAVEAAWRCRPRRAWLVFLHDRKIVPVSV